MPFDHEAVPRRGIAGVVPCSAVTHLRSAYDHVGLHPDRVVYCETWRDAEVLRRLELRALQRLRGLLPRP